MNDETTIMNPTHAATPGVARHLSFMTLIWSFLLLTSTASAQDPSLRFGSAIPQEVETVYERGLAWLASKQTDAGNWQGGNDGAGVDGICLMAFLASGEDPNFGRYAPNIRRALRAIIRSQDATSGYMPNSMYHHGFAMLSLSEAYGAVDESLLWEGGKPTRSISQALDLAIRCAGTAQKANRWGGWRYMPNSTDADTSVTGAVLMGLLAARNAGMEVSDEVIDTALEYMRRCTGKDGSVAYSGGFGGFGESMNRSAIATLVAAVSKNKDHDEFKATLKLIRSTSAITWRRPCFRGTTPPGKNGMPPRRASWRRARLLTAVSARARMKPACHSWPWL